MGTLPCNPYIARQVEEEVTVTTNVDVAADKDLLFMNPDFKILVGAFDSRKRDEPTFRTSIRGFLAGPRLLIFLRFQAHRDALIIVLGPSSGNVRYGFLVAPNANIFHALLSFGLEILLRRQYL